MPVARPRVPAPAPPPAPGLAPAPAPAPAVVPTSPLQFYPVQAPPAPGPLHRLYHKTPQSLESTLEYRPELAPRPPSLAPQVRTGVD